MSCLYDDRERQHIQQLPQTFNRKDFVASNSNEKRVAGKKYIDSINHRHITLYVCESIHHRMKVCH